MLHKGWNFHNDIAIPLEGIARKHYGDIDRPYTKIYDADSIEQSNFVEVMILILREHTQYDNSHDEIEQFVVECGKYLGVNGNTIPEEEAQGLFDEFCNLTGE